MSKHRKPTKKLVAAVAVALTMAVGTSSMGLTAFAEDTPPANNTYGGKYYTDFDSLAEAKKAAEELTRELAQEGDVLLKNKDNKALPLSGKEWVSVFGVRADNLIGASDSSGAFSGSSTGSDSTLPAALEHAGFKVNPTLKNFYGTDSSEIGSEVTNFNGNVKNSFKLYNDVAFVVLSREGGEGSDASRVTKETVGADDTHRALLSEGEGADKKTYKHYLMLTDSEEKLIEQVKGEFKKVVIITNTSNPMELGDLQKDDEIDAIVHIGRPGVGGLDGLADILKGTVSPSGGLVDEWMTDFTTDPTWYNFGNNNQTKGFENGAGSSAYLNEAGTKTGKADPNTAYEGDEGYYGVDYEESIYLGYKYYETYYYDKYMGATDDAGRTAAQNWWAANVTYPFGYGLSYTTFSFKAEGIFTDSKLENALGASVEASKFNSSKDTPAQVSKLYIPVTVTNTGSVTGKKTVQVYVTAPYTTGKIEKSAVTLVGFAKSDMLAPGESQTVVAEVNVQDMASWDYKDANGDGVKGDYELDNGEYVVRVMEDSHFDCATDVGDTTDAYDEVRFTLTAIAHLQVDDFSGGELKNLFTTGENDETTDWNDVKEDDLNYGNIRTANMMAAGGTGMTLLSRADMDATFPKAPTLQDLKFKDKVLKNWAYWDNFQVSDNPQIDSDTGLPGEYIKDGDYSKAKVDKEDYPWYKTVEDIPSTWTQATGVYDKDHKVQNNRTELAFPMYVSTQATIKFKDMYGVAYDDAKWDEFLNQLTYDELCTIVEFGGYSTVDIASVGKIKTEDSDGPNNWDSSHCWCSADIIASTWNVELAEKQGKIMGNIGLLKGVETGTQVGWYGPGADVHRSPFSGRNNEYYSQDGLHGGYMVAAVINGAQTTGIVCYVKHCFMNDQETNRGNLFTWADEQAIRENYCKAFQMALQEGGSKGAMVAYGRLGGLSNTNNYNTGTELYQNQWKTNAYFVTDGYIGWVIRTSPDMMVRAGNLMELYTTPFVEYLSGEWDATARDGKGMVKVGQTLPTKPADNPAGGGDNPAGPPAGGGDAPAPQADAAPAESALVDSPTQWYCVRMAAKSILYQLADTAAQRNGYSELNIAGGALEEGVEGAVYEDSVNIDSLLDRDSSWKLSVSGMLPAGLEIDTLTGEISGTPLVAGTYNFTVNYVIDGYIGKSARYTIVISPALALSEDGDNPAEMKVGTEFATMIVSEEFTSASYTSLKYSVKSGSLPDGVTLSEDGTITGTPTKAGTFEAVILLTAEKESSGGGGSKGFSARGNKGGEPTIETTTVEITVKFVVAGDGSSAEVGDNVPYIGDNGNWFVNGKDTGVAAQGPQGPQGPQGEKGAAGSVDLEEAGCNSSLGIGGISAIMLGLAAMSGVFFAVTRKKSVKSDDDTNGASGK